jgi:two-component system phosphate regulon sensor histidine kinase PhoR
LTILKARFAARLFIQYIVLGWSLGELSMRARRWDMLERGLTVTFCPSDCCTSGSRDAGNDETPDDEGELHGRDLLQAVDFYATVLAMAGHDLRQPLQVIVSAHELLARRLTARPEREHLERSEQASAQLEEKLDQLVDALQLHQRARRIEPQPVPLDPILQRLALQLDVRARRKGVDFRFLPTRAVILSEPVLLDGILRNLARNALDHTLPGGRVLVGCRRRGATVRVEVHDTGEGIAPDKLASIFEPFFRLDATRSEGLGLGLFIVRRAADCVGHRVELRSALGRGPCFTVVAEAAVV